MKPRSWARWTGGGLAVWAGALFSAGFLNQENDVLSRWVILGPYAAALIMSVIGLWEFVAAARKRRPLWGIHLTWSGALGLLAALVLLAIYPIVLADARASDAAAFAPVLLAVAFHLLCWAGLGRRWDAALTLPLASLLPFAAVLLATFSASTLLFGGVPSWAQMRWIAAAAVLVFGWLAVRHEWPRKVLGLAGVAILPGRPKRGFVGKVRAFLKRFTEQPSDRTQLRPVLWTCAGFLAGSLLVCLACRQVWHMRLNAHERLLHAAGFKTRFADYAFAPTPQDAHPRLTKALHGPIPQAKQTIKGSGFTMSFGALPRQLGAGRFPADAGSRFDTLMRQWSEYVDYVDRVILPAARTTSGWTPFDLTAHEPNTGPLPEYGNIVNVARVLAVKAYQDLLAGNEPAAWDRIRTAIGLTDLLRPHPFLIASMVGVANEGIVVSAAARLMLQSDDAVLPADIARDFRRWSESNPVAPGFAFETVAKFERHHRIHGQWLLPDPEHSRTRLENVLHSASTKLLDLAGTLDLNFLTYVSVLGPVPYWQTHNTFEERLEPGHWLPGMDDWMPPQFANLMTKGDEARTKARLVLLYSALKEYRKARGTYPARLADLAPRYANRDELKDSFGGGPYTYIRSAEGGGFYLASAGWRGNRTGTMAQWMSIRIGNAPEIFPPVVGAGFWGDGPAARRLIVVGLGELRDRARRDADPVSWLPLVKKGGSVLPWGDADGRATFAWKDNTGRVTLRSGTRWGAGVVLSAAANAPANVAGATHLVADVVATKGKSFGFNVNESGYDPRSKAEHKGGPGRSGADGEQFTGGGFTGTGNRQRLRVELAALAKTNNSNQNGSGILDAQAIGSVEMSIGANQGDATIEIHRLRFE